MSITIALRMDLYAIKRVSFVFPGNTKKYVVFSWNAKPIGHMKTAGIVLFVLGVVGVVYYGILALQNSESFTFLGIDVAVSDANWTPVLVSGIVTVVGLFIMLVRKKK
jgi:hypothetical protein